MGQQLNLASGRGVSVIQEATGRLDEQKDA